MPTSTTRPTRSSVGLRSERGPILLAVMVSLSLVAIDMTILATAVPSVVKDLGGFEQFPWLFSIYVLATAVTTPLYAKVADRLGRKPVMIAGIVAFLVGSLLCGMAWSLTVLIVFRAVQGIGAGAIQPMAMTIVSDIYTLEERAVATSYVASVWATAAIVGPTLGGIFADYLDWRLIFLINLPVGAVALWLLRHFHEDRRPAADQRAIDWAGAGLLTVGGIALLLGLLEGGHAWGWASPVSVTIFAVGIAALVAFGFVERRAADPVLPPWVLSHRVLAPANAASLIVGVVMLGLTTYVPLYAQSVLGHSALVAGFALAGMSIGWPIAAATAGRIYLSRGFRTAVGLGALLVLLGGAVLATVGETSSFWHLAIPCFVLGLGFGWSVNPGVVAAGSAVDWEVRGVATGSNMFARSVGSALGVALFGAVANGLVRSEYAGGEVPPLEALPPDVLAPALHVVFLVGLVVSVPLLVVAWRTPVRITR
ncbi:MDR family MFS transporter [Nocardioides sp. NPDC051685]|uniref:MDR family MFS transporter n=1 Tax=Nocardioides sp. NPDC051685 TaxID=3364334 RepID=UPI0037A9953C